jgi:hypothetical protein
MPVYNAAIPILEAYFKGAQLRQEREKAAEHAQLLKDQLSEQKRFHDQQNQLQQSKYEVERGLSKIKALSEISDLITKGKYKPPTYEMPMGVSPTGAKVPMDGALPQSTSLLSEAASGVPIGQQASGMYADSMPVPKPIEAPVLEQAAPPMPQAEMQTKTLIKPGTEIAGVDVSNLATVDEAMKREIELAGSKAGAITTAQETAKAPFVEKAQEFKAGESKLTREAQAEVAVANRVHQENLTDKRISAQKEYQKQMLDLRREIANETNEYRRANLAVAQGRLALQQQKLNLATKEGSSLEALIPDMKSGLITQEAIRLEPDKTIRAKMTQLARDNDVVLLTNKQSEDLKAMQVVRQFYDGAAKLAEKIKNSDVSRPSVIESIRTDQADLRSLLEPIAKGIGYKGAITGDEQSRLEALIPGIVALDSTTKNKTSLGFLRKFINTKVDSIVPPSHFTSKGRKLQRVNLQSGFNLLIDDPDEKK